MKRVHILGCSGNTEIAEIQISGDASMYGPNRQAQINEAAREAARVLYNRIPGHAWQAFVQQVNQLGNLDPYANL